MSLPPQDLPETMTRDEAMHYVAREWARNEIVNLKAGHLEMQKQLVEFMGTNQADSRVLRDMLATFPASVAAQIDNCRKEMRHEMEDDFPSKLENAHMERRIEEKIGDTDKTLGKQIAELDKKLDSTSASLAGQVKDVNTKVEKQWLKISMVVSTIVGVGGFATWYFTIGKYLAGG